MPPLPSYVGEVSLQTCGEIEGLYIAFVYGGKTQLLSLYGQTADGYIKCLAADKTLTAYSKTCNDTADTYWELVGKTVKNTATNRCLSANAAGEVYVALCDGAINRDWEFPGFISAADSDAVRAIIEARRAQLAAGR
jgi:hypothetical protein